MNEREDLELRALKLEQLTAQMDGDLRDLRKSTDECHKKFVIG